MKFVFNIKNLYDSRKAPGAIPDRIQFMFPISESGVCAVATLDNEIVRERPYSIRSVCFYRFEGKLLEKINIVQGSAICDLSNLVVLNLSTRKFNRYKTESHQYIRQLLKYTKDWAQVCKEIKIRQLSKDVLEELISLEDWFDKTFDAEFQQSRELPHQSIIDEYFAGKIERGFDVIDERSDVAANADFVRCWLDAHQGSGKGVEFIEGKKSFKDLSFADQAAAIDKLYGPEFGTNPCAEIQLADSVPLIPFQHEPPPAPVSIDKEIELPSFLTGFQPTFNFSIGYDPAQEGGDATVTDVFVVANVGTGHFNCNVRADFVKDWIEAVRSNEMPAIVESDYQSAPSSAQVISSHYKFDESSGYHFITYVVNFVPCPGRFIEITKGRIFNKSKGKAEHAFNLIKAKYPAASVITL